MARRTDKVDDMSGGLRLPAATHRGLTSGKHLLELEPILIPLGLALVCCVLICSCTCSPQRMIRAFGRFAGKWWLHQLGGYQQCEQLVGAMCIFRGLCVMGVRSCRWCEDELEARLSHTPVCTLLMALAAQLAADRMRAVLKGSACLEALPLPIQCGRHRSTGCV